MSSYYEEHDCAPLAEGEEPNHFLHLARLLLDSGLGVDWQIEFERLFGDERKPPAAKQVIATLPETNDFVENETCSICLKVFVKNETVTLPCKHCFHRVCIVPWLQTTNSCPVCRQELPTDDEDYEEYKKQKERLKQRENLLEELHNSMFT